MGVEREIALLAEADRRAAQYIRSVEQRRAFPSRQNMEGLSTFEEPLPEKPSDPLETLAFLDNYGTPGTVASNGPNYFGFVIGATLPAAAAADRLAASWDQCASSYANSPVMAIIEKTAASWLLEALDLPRESGVGFGTSATACGLACVATARSELLSRQGWEFEWRGLAGAPKIRAVVPATVHITVKKALRLLGFGLENVQYAPVDDYGRVLPDQLPPLDERTILCLQAGEVNTGEFDRFEEIIPIAKSAGSWVHVDGAFGLWARLKKKARPYNRRRVG